MRAGCDRVEGILCVVASGGLVQEHLGLVVGNSEGVPLMREKQINKRDAHSKWGGDSPEEGGVREEEVDDPAAEQHGAELLLPDLGLCLECRGRAERVHVVRQAADPERKLAESDGPARVAAQVEGRLERLVVCSPELVCVRGEEGRQLRVEEAAEVRVLALAEELWRESCQREFRAEK